MKMHYRGCVVRTVIILVFAFLPSFTHAQTATSSVCPDGFICTHDNNSSATSNEPCFSFTHNLGWGDGSPLKNMSYEPDVHALQDFLISKGYVIDASEQRGGSVFGVTTWEAVKAFQRASGFSPGLITGYAGALTRAILNNSCSTTPPLTTNSPQSRKLIITSVSGPTTLRERQANVWTIHTNAEELGIPANRLVYSADWGTPEDTVQTSNVFYYQFPNAGSYAARFSVSDTISGPGRVGDATTIVYMKVTNTTPSPITVISPKEGEKYVVGDTIKIKWSGGGTRLISIKALTSKGSRSILNLPATAESNTSGIFNYVIPSDILSGFTEGQFSVSVYSHFGGDDDDIFDSSLPFTISLSPQARLSLVTSLDSVSTPIGSIRAGEDSVRLMSFRITNNGSSALNLNGFAVRLNGINNKYIPTLKLYAESNLLATTAYRANGGYTLNTQIYIPANSTRVFTVKGDILTGASGSVTPALTEILHDYGTSLSVTGLGFSGNSLNIINGSIATSTAVVSLTGYLDNVNSDRVGLWNNFGPGAGNINKNPSDWNWKIRLILSSGKDIKRITMIHNTSGEVWSTGYSRYLDNGKDLYNGREEHPYPLAVYVPGSDSPLNTQYDKWSVYQATLNPQGQEYLLYGQPENTTFTGGNLIVEFTDGTSVSAIIPASNLSQSKVPSPYDPETSPRRQAVINFYHTLLARQPSEKEIMYWVSTRSDLDLDGIKKGFTDGPEYKARRTYIANFYLDLLNRASSDVEVDYWANNGLTRDQIETGIRNSYEYTHLSSYHPADLNHDGRIVISEVTAYGAKLGNTAEVRIASEIYKTGEIYTVGTVVGTWRNAYGVVVTDPGIPVTPPTPMTPVINSVSPVIYTDGIAVLYGHGFTSTSKLIIDGKYYGSINSRLEIHSTDILFNVPTVLGPACFTYDGQCTGAIPPDGYPLIVGPHTVSVVNSAGGTVSNQMNFEVKSRTPVPIPPVVTLPTDLPVAVPPIATTTTSRPISILTASLISATDDKAGMWNVFGPGAGNPNGGSHGDNHDFIWNASLTIGESKTIKSIDMRHNSAGEYWSTMNSGAYPLVVFVNGTQVNSAIGQTIGTYSAGTINLTIYGQFETPTFSGGTLLITFTDGTTVSASVPASNYSPKTVSQTSSAIDSFYSVIKSLLSM